MIKPPQCVLGHEIEHAVCSEGCGSAVVQVEEPNGAVNDGKSHGQESIDGSHRETVESELKGLVGRLGDLPKHVGRDQDNQRYGEEFKLIATICQRRKHQQTRPSAQTPQPGFGGAMNPGDSPEP